MDPADRSAKRFKLPPGFDQTKHRAQLDRTIAESPKYGAGWVIDHIDVEEGFCYVVKKAQIHEVVSGDHDAEVRTMRLAAGTKTSDGDSYAQWVAHTFPGFEVVVFEPGAGRAAIAKLPADLSRCRTALATALGCKPWSIKVTAKRRSDGTLVQFDTTLPTSFTPAKHGPKLIEVAQEIVGNLGWQATWDAMGLTATLVAGDPPMLPQVAPYPFDEPVGPWNIIPIGPALGGGVARWDLSAAPHLAIAGITGSGKRQPLTSPIPTPTGRTTIGELAVGDKVFTADGVAAEVTWLSEIVEGDIFEIVLSDGQVVRADAEHLWLVSTARSRKAHAAPPTSAGPTSGARRCRFLAAAAGGVTSDVEGILSMLDWCGVDAGGVLEMFDLLVRLGIPATPTGRFPLDETLWMVADELDRREQRDPSDDRCVLERIVTTKEMWTCRWEGYAIRRAQPVELPWSPLDTDPYESGASLAGQGAHPLDSELFPAWLRGSVAQRREVLHGAMDSAGCLDESGRFHVRLPSQTAARHMIELVRSLGGIATGESAPEESEQAPSGHQVSFTLSAPVFKRHPAARLGLENMGLSPADEWLHVVDVRRVAPEPARCIAIDHPSHLYLTDGFVPTHNTIAQEAVIVGAMARGFEVAIVDPTKGGVDFAWAEQFCRPGGWGCENLEEALTAISLVYAEGVRRKGLVKAHPGAVKWTDLGDPTIHPILLVADECTSLLAMEAAPKGLPKTDPIAVEIAYRNSVKARILNVVGKIARELRFVGVHLMLGSQKFYAEIVSGEMRSNLGARVLLGANPTNADRSMALRDIDAVPNIPAYLRDDPKVARGIGVFEVEGVGSGVFKGYFATHDDFSAYAERCGCVRRASTRPTASQIAEHCPSAVTGGGDDGDGDGFEEPRGGRRTPRRSAPSEPRPPSQSPSPGEMCPTCGGPVNLLTGECHCSW